MIKLVQSNLKKRLLISAGVIALLVIGFTLGTNYTSQQIDNMTLNLSDTAQNVNIKGISGSVTLNVTTTPVNDTTLFWRSDTTSIADTIILNNIFPQRVKLSISGSPADTLFVKRKSTLDSQIVYPGGYYASDYFHVTKDTLIVGPVTHGIPVHIQKVGEGR